MKDRRGGSWWRSRPVRLSGGGVCQEGIALQDQELSVEGAPAELTWRQKVSRRASSYEQTCSQKTRPASSGHRNSHAEDDSATTRVWPAGREWTVTSRSSGGGVAPRQNVRVARSPAESTASEAGHSGPGLSWGSHWISLLLGVSVHSMGISTVTLHVRSCKDAPRRPAPNGRPLRPLVSASSLQRLCRI